MIDKLWNAILKNVKVGQVIENFKGKGDSIVIGIDDDKITFQVSSNGTVTTISKKTFENILNRLQSDGRIRQKTAGKDPRISLGVLKLLPYFDTEKRDTTYLVWSNNGKEMFMKE